LSILDINRVVTVPMTDGNYLVLVPQYLAYRSANCSSATDND
jgi:hypothetical protein